MSAPYQYYKSTMCHLLLILFSALMLFFPIEAPADQAPLEIAGFRLGEDITEYNDIEYTNFLKEVVVTDWHGFRKGIISYGVCAYPGKIVKIRMKYEDGSRDFFDTLLNKYKQKFGKPHEYEGDAFGILRIWKWRFLDKNQNLVTTSLQHNPQDETENIGNIVKLSYPEREEEERLCFVQQCEENRTAVDKQRLEEQKETNWDFLIPR
ncbi:MAG: hypothetical protein HKP41_23140 [Desulfobacterales bacterium]|nr:hypothetical protein [Desulfobacterales bacterium]